MISRHIDTFIYIYFLKIYVYLTIEVYALGYVHIVSSCHKGDNIFYFINNFM